MTVKEIKQAVDDGIRVEMSNGNYVVIKDRIGQYLIKCLDNDHVVGLSGLEGTKYENVTNFPEDEFYIV